MISIVLAVLFGLALKSVINQKRKGKCVGCDVSQCARCGHCAARRATPQDDPPGGGDTKGAMDAAPSLLSGQ